MRAFIIWDALVNERARRFPGTFHNRESALAEVTDRFGLFVGETPEGLLEKYDYEIREITVSPEPVKVGL